MGTFTVTLEVVPVNGAEFVGVEALVDTGATHTFIGEDLLSSLGIEPTGRYQYQLGDDSLVEYGRGFAQLRLEGEEGIATSGIWTFRR